MKMFIFGLFLLSIVSYANAGEGQKLEGSCNGILEDGSKISFTYYSDFDGCSHTIAGSIKFSSESRLGFHKGKRTFENNKDIYTFNSKRVNTGGEIYRLTFEDSTGNVSGILDYLDIAGESKSITVQCLIYDFDYSDCNLTDTTLKNR